MFNKTSARVFLLITVCCLFSFTITSPVIPPVKVVNNFTAELPVKKDKHIVWDQTTLTKISSSKKEARYASYPRMIQLHDQSLFCVYEAAGEIVAAKSTDLGETWSEPEVLAAKRKQVNMSVPDLLELKDHTLLVFYNPRPRRDNDDPESGNYAINYLRSVDGGKSWLPSETLYKADSKFENGCWEPSAVQLPNGEVQLFFANESDYRSSNEQNISMLRSKDGGKSWTKKPEVVSFRKGARDGMPVPLLLKNRQEVVFAIEDNGFKNFKPYIIRNTIGENWKTTVDANSTNRSYALADRIDEQLYAGAPYLRQLSTGETILSYQGTEGRANQMNYADMKVVVGDSEARNFGSKSTPFVIAAGNSCLWNSLAILDDDTIVALTSTSAFGSRSGIWMIKGHLVDDQQVDSTSIPMADPTIFADKGKYYLYGTSSNKGFEVYQSSDLKTWSGPAGKNNGFVLSKGQSFGTGGFWAPQVFKRRSKYFMAYTANEQIAIASSDSPLGPFKQKVLKALSGTGKQIDPFLLFDDDGKVYLYHVKLQNGNRIFVAEMKPDLSDVVMGTEKECLSGTEQWENTQRTEWAVTEGPTIIKHKSLYYLIYSANDFRNKDYAVGYATSASPYGPWKKYSGNPIVSRANVGFNGTGHGDLYVDLSGNMQYVMHVHHSDVKVSPRVAGNVGLKFVKKGDEPDVLTADAAGFKLLRLK
ncbi:family 43 glycosylhydrolase [Pedobacter sp. PWIIR3]